MKVTELNRNQLIQLKQSYLTSKQDSVSWGELAEVDELVTDAEIFKEYAGINFVEDDFTE